MRDSVCPFVLSWICSTTGRISHLSSQTLCISQAFLCLSSYLSLDTSLGVNICRRFNTVSINISYLLINISPFQLISYKTYKSTKSPGVLRNDLANVQKNQMSLGNDVQHSAAHNSHRQIFLLSACWENILHQDRLCLQESFVFWKVHSLLLLQHVRQKTDVWILRIYNSFRSNRNRKELTLVMKCCFFATSHVLLRIGALTFLSHRN